MSRYRKVMLPMYVSYGNIGGAHVAFYLRCAPRLLVSSKLLALACKKYLFSPQMNLDNTPLIPIH